MDFDFDLNTSGKAKPFSELGDFDFDSFLTNPNVPEGAVNEGAEDDEEEEEDEKEEEPNKIPQQLRECLDECEHHGKFYSHGTYEQFPSPGIVVKNLGIIGLPLSVREAKAIAGECKQATFGKGDQTLVDESVRKTWELDASDFTCSNPIWPATLDELAQQSLQDLGVDAMAHAEPYKLLLYEEGAFFKAHRDTEKVPGMFGTLVVCLPSLHEGGSVRLVHGKEEHTIETAAGSAFMMTTLAWYSDVQHEIVPVTSGYRLVLTYNLIQDQSAPKQTAAALDASHTKLGLLLKAWTSAYSCPNLLVYPLDHQYTPTSLSLQNLKGQDAAKGRYLEALCSKNGAYWFLARMTRQEEVYDDDCYGEDEAEECYTASETVLPSGRPFSLGLHSFEKEHVLADLDWHYRDRTADSEDEAEFTGNAHTPAAYRYHDTVAVMIRKEEVLRLFAHSYHSAESLLAYFELISSDANCTTHQRSSSLGAILRHALFMLMPDDYGYGHNASWRFNPILYRPASEKKAGDYARVFEIVADCCHKLDLGGVVADSLLKGIEGKQWTASKEVVNLVAREAAKNEANGKEDVWDSWFSNPLPQFLTFTWVNERRKTLDMIEQILSPMAAISFRDWKQKHLDMLLRRDMIYTINDAESVMELLDVLPYPETCVGLILPKITTGPFATNTLLFLDLLCEKSTSNPKLRELVEGPAFKRFAPEISRRFKLSDKALTLELPVIRPGDRSDATATANTFMRVVKRCIEIDLRSEARDLLRTGLPQLPKPESAFWTRWKSVMAFIDSLIQLVQLLADDALNIITSKFVTEAVRSASTHKASSRPKKPRDWCRPQTIRCHCSPCSKVKNFLVDPVQQVGRFSYAAQTRKHIERNLGCQDLMYTTECGQMPYTLVVTKMNNKFDLALRQWNTEVTELWTHLSRMRNGFVFELLGGDIISISGIDEALSASVAGNSLVDKTARSSHTISPAAQNVAVPAPVAGVKRKAEVIDLTEDDPF
ncbi:hypothetical protein BDU57DRAFT_528829 [Ampelomyces quisqualis]|uniref:Prolyl 4-hydroxylase alpha subunit Fe(2+) 2OG dioxygenase domain-containing protein n=1 Tax=Ampelomyces quisqualis TaxID=50730 RepID=A0A6A5QSQ9_AMPQU|nr:hypothetical protein BDU57DRAFT_528829 [Ampelomyces quisqualis]